MLMPNNTDANADGKVYLESWKKMRLGWCLAAIIPTKKQVRETADQTVTFVYVVSEMRTCLGYHSEE